MSATIGRINVNDAIDGVSTVIWNIRDAMTNNLTPYPTDMLQMWKQHLLTAMAVLSDIQSVMKDEWEQELRDANDMIP